LLYELHYNEHPFKGFNQEQIAENIINKEVEFPEPWELDECTNSSNRKTIKSKYKSFNKMISKLLRKDPEVVAS
jgi:serine/threonine protein kinase